MPRYGFNFQWMFSRDRGPQPQPPDEKALDFLAAQSFNFVRIPCICFLVRESTVVYVASTTVKTRAGAGGPKLDERRRGGRGRGEGWLGGSPNPAPPDAITNVFNKLTICEVNG